MGQSDSHLHDACLHSHASRSGAGCGQTNSAQCSAESASTSLNFASSKTPTKRDACSGNAFSVSFDCLLNNTETSSSTTTTTPTTERASKKGHGGGRSPKPARTDSTNSENTQTTLMLNLDAEKVHSSVSMQNLIQGQRTRTPPKKKSADDNNPLRNKNTKATSKSRDSVRIPTTSSTGGGSASTNSINMLNYSSIKNARTSSAISNSAQQIIAFCMENARGGDVAARVFARMAHKRDDFAEFCANLSAENSNAFIAQFRDYLMNVLRNLQNAEKVVFCLFAQIFLEFQRFEKRRDNSEKVKCRDERSALRRTFFRLWRMR